MKFMKFFLVILSTSLFFLTARILDLININWITESVEFAIGIAYGIVITLIWTKLFKEKYLD